MKSSTLKKARVYTIATAFAAICSTTDVVAEEPGRGVTAKFEIHYLKMMIDHHFTALRMTELAAGTETRPTSSISSDDGVRPTPGFPPSEPHSTLDELKSLSRTNNRMQREEILTAQQFLKDWYGISYEPHLTHQAGHDIENLENLQGASFDKKFIVTMSGHHYVAASASLKCLVARDLTHHDLRRYCQNILNAQVSDIEHMRHLACEKYDQCETQPQENKPPRRR